MWPGEWESQLGGTVLLGRYQANTGGPVVTWTCAVITLLPEAFPGLLGLSLAGRALKDGVWALETIPLRSFGLGNSRAVDDSPAGGGPGMVLRADVVAAAVDVAKSRVPGAPAVYLSPRGRRLDQGLVREWAAGPGLVLLSGRFEGVDERVIEGRGLVEVSLGDFILSGGEPAAMAAIDACVRLLPGVMGKVESGREESFEGGLLEYPHYTRPREWEGRGIPEPLLSGDHARIARWRRDEAMRLTRERRPDLLVRKGAEDGLDWD